ncbi:MAG: hypothetical protein PGN13_15240 [Patulibacter minatonensis]
MRGSPRSCPAPAGSTSTRRTTRCRGERYVVTAYGRDYGDVAPVTGVIYTRGRTTSLRVTVDVAVI